MATTIEARIRRWRPLLRIPFVDEYRSSTSGLFRDEEVDNGDDAVFERVHALHLGVLEAPPDVLVGLRGGFALPL